MNDLNLIFAFILQCLTKIAELYQDNFILSLFFTLWLLDKVFGIFDRIRGR